MLTRLTVSGFKNLHDVSVDFGPFTCVAGANAAGKSNLFDAIEFLALLADHPLMEAAQLVRNVGSGRTGDPRDLFWDGYGRDMLDPLKLAAEMIVPRQVEDDFGQEATASITYLRYEVELGYSPSTGRTKIGRLELLAERLEHINLGNAPARLRFKHSAKHWRQALVTGRRSGTAFISTDIDDDGERLIKVHQDGGSRGQPRVAAAGRSPATIVSTTTQAADPTILAARREMQSWRRLALVPSAMRAPDSYTDPPRMGPDGSHLAATLHRVSTTDEQGNPDDTFASVAERLSSLTGLKIRDLHVDADDARETFTLLLREQSGIKLPARSLSEGTLRFLALCVLLEDPTVTGLLCLEEPENGIHPLNVAAMVDLIRDLVMDPQMPPGPDNPFRQVIVNTHSPSVVQLVGAEDLLYADLCAVGSDTGSRPMYGLRLRPVAGTWRDPDRRFGVGKADLLAYLSEPPGAQLSLTPTTHEAA